MDDLAETELHEATAGLGNWHSVNDKPSYLVNKDECVSCLQDLQIALKHDTPERGNLVHLKLGEWKVMSNHLVPLFTSYRDDSVIATLVLRVMVQLTTHANVSTGSKLQHLEHLQDYKEAFAKADVFIILMSLLVESMEEDEESGVANKKDVFEGVLALLRNLVSVPDPRPGEPGFTPNRRHLQLAYIRHFHDEGVLDFFLLFAEALAADQNTDQAWALADILYHVCTHLDPEELNKSHKEKHKRVLKDLLAREQADSRIRMPQASRHARFGTAMQTRTAQGAMSISTSVTQNLQVHKGGALFRREYRDRDTEKKRSMFHDPFFVDLEEGSVRDHNQLNAHVKNVLDSAKTFGDNVLGGLRKFFEDFMHTCFSTIVGLLRSSLITQSAMVAGQSKEFCRPKLLNFLSWTLEFHRHHYSASVAKAREAQEQVPIVDIASIQGAIDLDMLQFLTARLREYGKGSQIHASHLVVVLRALSQQVKTISLILESKDADTRDCGEILTQNIVKDDVMAHLAWVMKNFKTSTHDPRVLSYTVEIFHIMLRLMGSIAERQGGNRLEFRVEKQHGLHVQRNTTTASKEVASLADGRVIENLFHLLEKYKRQSHALTSMLVKLIYKIIQVQPSNIVVFFELSYFMRIFRMCSDPLLFDKKMGVQYQEMLTLLQYILRQFFKCAEINGCAFVELLFRKVVQEKGELLESHSSEFQAILDNYENEEYKSKILDRIAAGETLEAMKRKQKQALDGSLPWTEEEDNILRSRYPVYADHPLCAELISAELPETSHRTARLIRKRLVELGLVKPKGLNNESNRQEVDSNIGDSQPDFPEALKPKRPADEDPIEQEGAKRQRTDMDASQKTGDDEADLEMDLERLLDEAMDSKANQDVPMIAQSPMTAQSPGQPDAEAALATDLEAELAKLMEADGFSMEPRSPAPPQSPAPRSRSAASAGASPAPRAGAASPAAAATVAQSQEDSGPCELESVLGPGFGRIGSSDSLPDNNNWPFGGNRTPQRGTCTPRSMGSRTPGPASPAPSALPAGGEMRSPLFSPARTTPHRGFCSPLASPLASPLPEELPSSQQSSQGGALERDLAALLEESMVEDLAAAMREDGDQDASTPQKARSQQDGSETTPTPPRLNSQAGTLNSQPGMLASPNLRVASQGAKLAEEDCELSQKSVKSTKSAHELSFSQQLERDLEKIMEAESDAEGL